MASAAQLQHLDAYYICALNLVPILKAAVGLKSLRMSCIICSSLVNVVDAVVIANALQQLTGLREL